MEEISSRSLPRVALWWGGFQQGRSRQMFARDKVVSIVQELRESRGGRPGLSVLTSLLVSVDVKNY